MAAFSLDLRRRILDAALADGAPTEHALAERFGVSRGFVQKLKRRWRTDGTAEPAGHRGGALADIERRYTPSPRHTIQVDFYPYLREIARERRRGRRRPKAQAVSMEVAA